MWLNNNNVLTKFEPSNLVWLRSKIYIIAWCNSAVIMVQIFFKDIIVIMLPYNRFIFAGAFFAVNFRPIFADLKISTFHSHFSKCDSKNVLNAIRYFGSILFLTPKPVTDIFKNNQLVNWSFHAPVSENLNQVLHLSGQKSFLNLENVFLKWSQFKYSIYQYFILMTVFAYFDATF